MKGNQGKLHRAFKDDYDPKLLQAFDGDSHLSYDKSHSRLERCAVRQQSLSPPYEDTLLCWQYD
ncbi:MAG: hypothetical protein ACI9DG_000855 [Oleispira sp.]